MNRRSFFSRTLAAIAATLLPFGRHKTLSICPYERQPDWETIWVRYNGAGRQVLCDVHGNDLGLPLIHHQSCP